MLGSGDEACTFVAPCSNHDNHYYGGEPEKIKRKPEIQSLKAYNRYCPEPRRTWCLRACAGITSLRLRALSHRRLGRSFFAHRDRLLGSACHRLSGSTRSSGTTALSQRRSSSETLAPVVPRESPACLHLRHQTRRPDLTPSLFPRYDEYGLDKGKTVSYRLCSFFQRLWKGAVLRMSRDAGARAPVSLMTIC